MASCLETLSGWRAEPRRKVPSQSKPPTSLSSKCTCSFWYFEDLTFSCGWDLLHEGVQVFCHFKPRCVTQRKKKKKKQQQKRRVCVYQAAVNTVLASCKSVVQSVGAAETQPFFYERGHTLVSWSAECLCRPHPQPHSSFSHTNSLLQVRRKLVNAYLTSKKDTSELS